MNVEEQATGTATAEEKVKATTEPEEKVFQMDAEPIKVKINVFSSTDKTQNVTHTLRKPTFAEEEARERMSALYITEAGRIDGSDATSMSLDDEKGTLRIYDKIALSVQGYALEPGQKPTEEDIPVDTVLTVNGEEKTVRDLIPISHKGAVINGMFPASYELDFGGEEFYYSLGGSREWKIVQEIGGKFKREDGTLSPADYTIRHILREPTQEERKKFRTQAISAVTLRTTSGNKDRRSTNLRVVADLYDALVQTIDNATIDGKTIDARDKKQLEKISATFKKGVVIRLMNFLEADLSELD